MALFNFGTITNITDSLLGITQLGEGADLARAGASISAAGFRNSGAAAVAAANYNSQLETINLNRRLDALGRQAGRIASSQTAQAGASGLASTSKSFLFVMNDTISQFEREIVQQRNTTAQRIESIQFEGRAAASAAENQARAAEFSGEVQAYQAEVQQSKAITSTIGNVFSSILGG